MVTGVVVAGVVVTGVVVTGVVVVDDVVAGADERVGDWAVTCCLNASMSADMLVNAPVRDATCVDRSRTRVAVSSRVVAGVAATRSRLRGAD
jgi:hypothetical protein